MSLQNELFFASHPDAETRRRGQTLLAIIAGMREEIISRVIAPDHVPMVAPAPLETSKTFGALPVHVEQTRAFARRAENRAAKERIMREKVLKALEAHDWVESRSAFAIGFSVGGLRYWIKKLNLSRNGAAVKNPCPSVPSVV